MKPRIPRLLAYACHESAHAVVCLALGKTFKCIQISNEERPVPAFAQLAGATKMTSRGRLIPTDDLVYRDDALSEVKVQLAGIAFEKERRPHISYFELSIGICYGDWENAVSWLEYHFTGDDRKLTDDERVELDRMLLKARREVRQIVRERWADILAVGKALIERRELSQAEVELLLSQRHI